jgi:hypothetical protein
MLEIGPAEESESRDSGSSLQWIDCSDSGSSLQWIDCSDPGNIKSTNIRRLIHQHSMKEIGKSRRKRQKRQRSERVQLDLSTLEPVNTVAMREAQARPSLWLGTAAGVDPFISYPFELDSAAQELIALGGFPACHRCFWACLHFSNPA